MTLKLALVFLYVGAATASSACSLYRYRNFSSGWAWDLAHVNQSFWAWTHGVNRITVRPVNHYAREGPEPWRSVHLAVTRLALLPAYAAWPRPETLLVGHGAIFWLSIFGVARLARGAQTGGSSARPMHALVAAVLWTATPAPLVMAINDCRPLQLGVPFLFWAIAGFVERRPWLFLAAAVAALGSRQEYGVAIAAVALLGAVQPEPRARTWRWRVAALALGAGWFAGYLVYLRFLFGPEAVSRYFTVPSSFARGGWTDMLGGLCETLGSLALLTGGWCVLALFSPRYIVASLPLVCMIAQRNLTRLVPGDEEWHMIRYAAIPVTFWVAGGAASWGGLATGRWAAWWAGVPTGRKRAAATAAALGAWLAPSLWVLIRLSAIAPAVPAEDRRPLRELTARIPVEATVWSDLPVAAMLSSRPRLYSFRDPLVQFEPDIEGSAHQSWALGPASVLGTGTKLGGSLRNVGYDQVFGGKDMIVLRYVGQRPAYRPRTPSD